jgi:glutathione S-transferase
MIKLFYAEGACSLSPHIVLEELGIPYEGIKIDFSENTKPEFFKLNPMGAVPTIEMDNGQPLTEGVAIVQYLCDLKPEANLLPRAGTMERYRAQEWLNFISTELHKGFSNIFGAAYLAKEPRVQDEIRDSAWADLSRKFDIVTQKMGSQPFLLSTGFSAADAYLFTILSWAPVVKRDLSKWPNLVAYVDRIKQRPAVMRTLKAENLL